MVDLAEQDVQPVQAEQELLDVAQDHANVVPAAAEHGKDRVAVGSLERASGQAAIGFHVPNHGLDCTAPSQEFSDGSSDAPPGTGHEDLYMLHAVAAVPAVDEGKFRSLIRQDLDLLQRLSQRVAVVGITRQRPHPDHKAAPVGGGDADLGAELVTLARPALRDAVHRRFVQAVELLLVLRLLRQKPVHKCDHLQQALPLRVVRNVAQLPFDIAQHPTGAALEPAQRLAHPFELAGMGVVSDLSGQPGRETVVILAQADPGLARPTDQLAPGRLTQAGGGRVRDGLPHYRGINRDPLEVVALHRPGAFAGLDRLGQHPLDTFLADPLAPACQRYPSSDA